MNYSILYLDYNRGKEYFKNNSVNKLFQRFLSLLNSRDIETLIQFANELKLEYGHLFLEKKFVSVDGIIGAGKSFIIEQYFKNGNVIIEEPLELWLMIICQTRDGFEMDIFSEFNLRINKKRILIFEFLKLFLLLNLFCD
jgi:hypothetical protein